MSATIPEGWYPDPADAASARWWSGQGWTAHTRVIPAALETPAVVAPPSAPVAVAAPSVTPVAVATSPAAPVAVVSPPATPDVVPLLAPGVPAAPAWVREIGAQTTGTAGAPGSDWRGSPDTVGIWLLAFAPLMTNIVVFGAVFALTLARVAVPVPVLFALPVILAEWVFAFLDGRALAARGYRRPGLAWMLLLPPLVYLIVRGRRVRERGARAWPPELAYFLQVVLIGAANVLLTQALR